MPPFEFMTDEEIKRAVEVFEKRMDEVPFQDRYAGLIITDEYRIWLWNNFYAQSKEELL